MERSFAQKVEGAEVDAAIERLAPRAFAFLERLVAEPSTVGHEAGAQRVLGAELERLGFDVRELEVPETIGQAARRGRPAAVLRGPAAGRRDAAGRPVARCS